MCSELMRRWLRRPRRAFVAAALAVAMGLGYPGRADAQIIYGYSTPPTSGMMTGGSFLMPLQSGTMSAFSSPLGGVMPQRGIGPSYPGSYGFNRFNGMGYNGGYNWTGVNTGFYQPNTFGNPYFGNPYVGFSPNMSFMGMGRWHR